jgi:hypothetical protein
VSAETTYGGPRPYAQGDERGCKSHCEMVDLAMSGGEFERDMSQNIMKIVLVKPKLPS